MSQTIRQKVDNKKTYNNMRKGHSVIYILASILLNIGISFVVYYFTPNTNNGYLSQVCLIISSIILTPALLILVITYHMCDEYTLGINKKQIYNIKPTFFQIGHLDLFILLIEYIVFGLVSHILGAYNVAIMQCMLTMLSFVWFVIYSSLFINKKFRVKRANKIIELALIDNSINISPNNIVSNATHNILDEIRNNNVGNIDEYMNLVLYLYNKSPKNELYVDVLSHVTRALVDGQYFAQLKESVCEKIYQNNSNLYYLLLPKILEQLSKSIMVLTPEQIEEHKIFQQMFMLIQKVEDKSVVHKVAFGMSNYYKNMLANANLNENILLELKKEMFSKLSTFAYVPDIIKHQNIYCLLMLIKNMVEQNDTSTFSLLLDAIYTKYNSDKDSAYIVIIAIQLYLYYLTIQGKSVKQFYDQVANNKYGYNQNLVHHMQFSKGRYLQYFWKIVYLIKTFDLTYLSTKNSNLALDVVIAYYLSYFKVFALSNAVLSLDRTNLPEYYNEILTSMITYIKNNEKTSGPDLDKFLSIYDIEFDKQNEDYIRHIDMIDYYITDRYINAVFDNINSDNERLNVVGTERFNSRLMDSVLNNLHLVAFSTPSSQESIANNTISQVIDTNELLCSESTDNLLKTMTKNYVDYINTVTAKTLLNKSKLRNITYFDNGENLSNIKDLCEKYEVDTISSPISKNIHIVSNVQETNLQAYITFEYKLNKLSGIESPNYLFANSKLIKVYNYPKSINVRELTIQELTEILESKKIRGNRYHIENFVSTYEDAKNYYQKTKRVVEINFNLQIEYDQNAGFVIKFHE